MHTTALNILAVLCSSYNLLAVLCSSYNLLAVLCSSYNILAVLCSSYNLGCKHCNVLCSYSACDAVLLASFILSLPLNIQSRQSKVWRSCPGTSKPHQQATQGQAKLKGSECLFAEMCGQDGGSCSYINTYERTQDDAWLHHVYECGWSADYSC